MDKVTIKFRVFFEEPFWIGLCERVVDDKLVVCKITFGSEPREQELEEYILRYWYQLRFSPSTDILIKHKDKVNPKRLQRDVKKQMNQIGIGTKSQQALKLQQELSKLDRKLRVKRKQEEEQNRLFALKKQKRKEKHRGR